MCGGNMRGMPVVSLLLDTLPLPAVLPLLQVLAQLPGQVGAVGSKKIQQLRKLTNLSSKTFVYILQCSGAGGTEIILKIRSRNYLCNWTIFAELKSAARMNKNYFLPLLRHSYLPISYFTTVTVPVHFKVVILGCKWSWSRSQKRKKSGAGTENKPFRLRKTDTGVAEETSLYRVLWIYNKSMIFV